MDKYVLEELIKSPQIVLSTSTSSCSSGSGSIFFDSEDELGLSREEHVRNENYFEETVPSYSEKDFKRHFRMSRSSIQKICDLLDIPKNYVGGWPEISKEKAVHICLYYLANTNTFREVGDKFNITESACFNIIDSVTQKLRDISVNYIKLPSNDEKEYISSKFVENDGLPFAVGAIDGCHLEIPKPKEHQEDYYNRKGFHSIVLQGVVNHEKLFLDIYVGEPGSLHDARVLKKSPLYCKLEISDELRPYYLLADSAYPASVRWLVPPFRDNGNLTENQKRFNQRLSKKRIVVEHAFGLLKGRFRRLTRFSNTKIDLVINCVVAAVVLHNVCIKWDDLDEEFMLVEDCQIDQYEQNIYFHQAPEHFRRDEIFHMLYG